MTCTAKTWKLVGASSATQEIAACKDEATVIKNVQMRFAAASEDQARQSSKLSAEYGNVELGVLHDDPNLADAVEAELRQAEEHLYMREVCLEA